MRRDESSSFGANGFEMMGMLNALKTGDVYADMVIAMCVPFILKMLFTWVGKLESLFDIDRVNVWLFGTPDAPEPEHERFISHTTTSNGRNPLDPGTVSNRCSSSNRKLFSLPFMLFLL